MDSSTTELDATKLQAQIAVGRIAADKLWEEVCSAVASMGDGQFQLIVQVKCGEIATIRVLGEDRYETLTEHNLKRHLQAARRNPG